MLLIQYFPQNGSVFVPQSKKVTFQEYREMVKYMGKTEGITWKAHFC
jgi:hypothetical protein